MKVFRAISRASMKLQSNVSETDYAFIIAHYIYPDDGSRDSFRNVGLKLHTYTADRTRRLHCI
jgi:hypothetical protein